MQINFVNRLRDKMSQFPTQCPSCSSNLAVRKLSCDHCETEVGGHYPLPHLASLLPHDQDFILRFVQCSGSLKEMAKLLGVSYPTVRNRLNEIIDTLKDKTP